MPFGVFNYTIAPDNRTVVFVTTEPAGTRSVPVIYSIQEDGKRLTRLAAGEAPSGEGEGGGGGFFGRGGISNLNVTRDGRSLFYQEGNAVYSLALQAQAAGAAAPTGATAGGRESARRRVNFVAKVKVDKPEEWA